MQVACSHHPLSMVWPRHEAPSRVSSADVASSLPDVGYTVAIEWAYYAFILLSAFCLVIGLLGDKLYEKRRFTTLHKMDVFSRIFYPAFIALVVGLYWWRLRG